LRHPEPPADCERTPWTFRAADVDVAGHVNNSHFWEPLEEGLAGSVPDAIDVEIEHREPALPGPAFVLRDGTGTWIEGATGELHASIQHAQA
jgi:acyl-ACP thioesterase